MKKKLIIRILMCALAAGAIYGCGSNAGEEAEDVTLLEEEIIAEEEIAAEEESVIEEEIVEEEPTAEEESVPEDGGEVEEPEEEIVEERPNGRYTYTYDNGDVYTGRFQDGMRDGGQGTMTYANGDKYVGDWQADLRIGQGTMTYANGDVYEGDWQADLRIGQGTMTYANGDVYEGGWQADQRNGWGVMYYANGDYYEGDWQGDQRSGYGVMYYANGDYYDGEFAGDLINGRGIYMYKNGSYCDGEFANGEINGQCTIWMASFGYSGGGATYEGTWQGEIQPIATYSLNGLNGIFGYGSGYGTVTFPDNILIYEGEWWPSLNENGSYDGGAVGRVSSLEYYNGNVYEGEIGVMRGPEGYNILCKEGQGTMYYANRQVYEGGWHEDKREGHGTLWSPVEHWELSGIWRNDNMSPDDRD